MRLEVIDGHRDRWPIAVICRVLEVSRAAYYKWKGRVPGETEEKRNQILAEIKQVYAMPRNQDYGSPRVHRELLRRGVECCVNTVAKIMQQAGITARPKRNTLDCGGVHHP